MSEYKCHLCRGELIKFETFPSMLQVTSDCRPWRPGGELAVCQQCGTVQKPVTAQWLRETNEIYFGYEIYSLGNGEEQPIFDQNTGTAAPRSQKIVQWLSTLIVMPETGKLLDVGCGNGSFLRAFGARYPMWQIMGLEQNSHYKESIESIKGVRGLYVGSPESVRDRFDLITLVHSLEHIANPIHYLKSLRALMNPGGLLLIEVPDLETSPFDILIADHCTHFTEVTLRGVVSLACFDTQSLEANFLPKELTLLAKFTAEGQTNKEYKNEILIKKQSHDNGERVVKSQIIWLQRQLHQGQEVEGMVGIFGTSISATWIAASLGDKVGFFVDEDRNRIGRTHMSRPIYDPLHVPENSKIIVPLRMDIAASIAKRFDKLNIQFILPSF